jgi:hypothetical protein
MNGTRRIERNARAGYHYPGDPEGDQPSSCSHTAVFKPGHFSSCHLGFEGFQSIADFLDLTSDQFYALVLLG